MLSKSSTPRSFSWRKFVKLFYWTIVAVLAMNLLCEKIVILCNLTQIEQVLHAFGYAFKEHDVDLAYAQCLPPELGGELSYSAVQAIFDSNGKYIAPFYLITEVDRWYSRSRIIWLEGQLILEANIVGRTFYGDQTSVFLHAMLRKVNGRWYIVSFPSP